MKDFHLIVQLAKQRNSHRKGETKRIFVRLEVERLLAQIV